MGDYQKYYDEFLFYFLKISIKNRGVLWKIRWFNINISKWISKSIYSNN